MRRAGPLLCLVFCACAFVPSAGAQPANARNDRVLLLGVGTAHGLGMAMDGIEGQAEAGWSHDRILSLFYPGTTTGRAAGTIRVGLSVGGVQHFVMPGGGSVTGSGPGFPMRIAPGARVTITGTGGRPSVDVHPSTPPAPEGARPAVDAGASLIVSEPTSPLRPPFETPPPSSRPPVEPSPEPSPSAPGSTPAPEQSTGGAPAASAPTSVRLVPAGNPAVVKVDSTGRQYRGFIEVRPEGRTLRVVNHVNLETYVAGIAEQKGSGWPLEAYKALAVAARSFAASAMTWRSGNHANGYDICPTQSCQVYLGFDGEEAIMRRAATETAGQVRVYDGRPIMAMYHGNGGGQTESYKRISPTRSDAYPYLKSVRYPHAEPHTWKRDLTFTEIGRSLAAAGVSAPRPLERLEILERGDSPRVVRMRLHGAGKHTDISGTTFMNALDLWSTWFEIGQTRVLTAIAPGGVPAATQTQAAGVPADVTKSGLVAVLAIAIVALAMATRLRASDDRLPLFEPAPSRAGP
ncbi:MAG TPA: SpoIID/LytB domain-containing protein [Actinomycetota bacterium]|nr:SpoIID/LytB domain-containing protein [Actinomycetota bacterium]